MHSFVSGCCSLNIKRALKQFGTPNNAPGKKRKKKKEDTAKTKAKKEEGGKYERRLNSSLKCKIEFSQIINKYLQQQKMAMILSRYSRESMKHVGCLHATTLRQALYEF